MILKKADEPIINFIGHVQLCHLTDMNNYRSIALSNVESKILEKVILTKVVTHSDVEKHQFGFKKVIPLHSVLVLLNSRLTTTLIEAVMCLCD